LEHILTSHTTLQITSIRPQERGKLVIHTIRYQPV